METSLHRQLKWHYVEDQSQHEVRCEGFRIDAVRGKELIEIQHGSLSAIRDKIAKLLKKKHTVRVVKPIVAEKLLVKLDGKEGEVVSRRRSPKRGTLLDVFDHLVYFTRVFPHKQLILDVPLVKVEEHRYPGHGKRRRRRERDFVVQDQLLTDVVEVHSLRTHGDLRKFLPKRLPRKFHTGHLAEQLQIPRWTAQRIAYCLRETGSLHVVGKEGNAVLYSRKAA